MQQKPPTFSTLLQFPLNAKKLKITLKNQITDILQN